MLLDAIKASLPAELREVASALAKGAANIEDLMLLLMTERSNTLNSLVSKQASEIQLKNEAKQSIISLIQLLHVLAAEGTKSLPDEVLAQLRKCGVYNESSSKHTGHNLKLLIEKLKAKLDAANASSQMEMARLNELISKNHAAISQMSDMISKMSKQNGTIVSNLR